MIYYKVLSYCLIFAIENPCKRGIPNAVYCGRNEECRALTPGLGHECVCKEGYIKFDDVCVGK